LTPRPLASFPAVNRFLLPGGKIIHRIHARAFAPDSFNPCRGRPTRFAPLLRADGSCIPTAYAAETFECAAHETVFHEIQHDAPRKTIDADAVEALDYATISAARNLNLCALFKPDLNRWGLTRQNLIDTFPSRYKDTAPWAIAIHDAAPDIDGLIWTSRRCDPQFACLLFGDRVGDALAVHARHPIGSTPALLAQMRDFGNRAGITLVI
jgi:hypothetical protein